MSERPQLIAIDRDDYHAEHVGRLSDGCQFFLTTPFEPSGPLRPGGEFVALYLFDPDGNLLEAKIDEFGPRSSLDENARRKVFEVRLSEVK